MTDDRMDERTGAAGRTAAAVNRRYEDWPIEGGGAWHYDEHGGELFETDPDSDNCRLVRSGESRRVDSDAGLGEAVERLGKELGWESLSVFAREPLEGDEYRSLVDGAALQIVPDFVGRLRRRTRRPRRRRSPLER